MRLPLMQVQSHWVGVRLLRLLHQQLLVLGLMRQEMRVRLLEQQH